MKNNKKKLRMSTWNNKKTIRNSKSVLKDVQNIEDTRLNTRFLFLNNRGHQDVQA